MKDNLKNRFYSYSRKEQLEFQLKIGIIAFILNILIALVFYLIDIRFMLLTILTLSITLSLIAPFFDIPSLVKNGRLTYHSLLLLAERNEKGMIKIHGGTLFDYYFVIKRNLNGKQRTSFILSEYLKGIKNLVREEHESVVIKGTTYMINERTARKIGLRKVKTDWVQSMILLYNYFNLMATMYLAKNELIFPNLKKISTYQGRVSNIRENMPHIDLLIRNLEGEHT